MLAWQRKLGGISLSVMAAALLSACAQTSGAGAGADTGADAASVEGVAAMPAKLSNAVDASTAISALDTNKQLEGRLLSDYDLIKQVSSQISSVNIYDETMQPVNKKEKCLLPFMVNDSDGKMQLYWDGECKNGYASGLGRVVRALDGKKRTELLVEIDPQVKDTLVSYLRYDVNTGDSEVGYSIISLEDNKLVGSSATWGYNDQEWLNGTYEVTYRYEDTTNFVSYTRIFDLLSGEFSSIVAYPNFSHDLLNAHDNVLSNIDKTYRLLEGRSMIGLSYIWLKDGRLLMRDNASREDHLVIEHPKELDQYVQSIEDKVENQVKVIDSKADVGFAKIEEYSNNKCRQLNAFFRGDEVNYVCDYLFNVSNAYDDLMRAQEMRSHQIDTYRENQEQRLKQLEQVIKSFNKVHLSANQT